MFGAGTRVGTTRGRFKVEALAKMGANSQQGWALLLFIVGFTFLPAGLFALGPFFSIFGLACLIASAVWCYRIKPLEHGEPASTLEPVSKPLKARQAL